MAIFYSNILFYTVLLWYSCYMLGCVIIQNHRISFTKSLFYFLKKLFLFNWKIIALQCCVSVCHTST